MPYSLVKVLRFAFTLPPFLLNERFGVGPVAMSDDMMPHFSSNSNQSDPSFPLKLAKLEARMAGKPSSTAFTTSGEAAVMVSSSSSDDDDGGQEFLVCQNIHKRKADTNAEEGNLQQLEGLSDGRRAFESELDQSSGNPDENSSRKRLCGRGRNNSGRGRGSKSNEQRRASTSPSNRSSIIAHTDSQDEVLALKTKCLSLESELSKIRLELVETQQINQHLEKELKDVREQGQQKEQKCLKVLSDLLIAVAKVERQEARARIRNDSLRLGNVSIVRAGTIMSEAWEDGQAVKDIQTQLRSLLEQKEAIERHRKSLKKGKTDRLDGTDSDSGMLDEGCALQEELCRCRLLAIKRDEEALLRDRERYELERARHIREMKRIRDEDGSRFNSFPILNKRFALLNLLGRGGFSEVYKAYDLVEHRYVACKLHSLNAQWSEEKKQSYIRHAMREYNIHKRLVHPHIVMLWDIFEIDHNTFCTVLEFCSGKDLDAVLKMTPSLPEKEARCIIVQIFSGLVYLNNRSQRIIHYDLKPGNVLFDHLGVAKMTDFGLSKIVEEEVGSMGMELTSQGAGTYWYLPPECFDISRTPMISSKVDVWSAGILFYQMLFGKRPFGHDQTQERILREDTIVKARRVEFPSKPSVSNEAKELIKRCLTYNQAERPDVLSIVQDPYLSYVKRKP